MARIDGIDGFGLQTDEWLMCAWRLCYGQHVIFCCWRMVVV